MLNSKSHKRKALSYLLGTVFIVFFIYSFSLFRPWQPFDERLFYNEEFLPIPLSINEIFEIIKSFVFNYHVLSMNTFFSNQTTLRSNPLTFALIVFVSFFFKNHAVPYHLLQLFIHLINVTLVYLIFKKMISASTGKQLDITNKNFALILITLFTLIWGLHSASTEAILLVSNWTALLTYTFCFCFLLYEISTVEKDNFTTLQIVRISILFCLLMFFTEYAYSLPLIIFFIIFSFTLKTSYPINKAITVSLKKSFPYILGLLLYLLFSLINPDSTLSNIFKPQSEQSSLYAFFERNLWLTPQTFIHFLKLFFFPKTLSTYQSNLIYLSNHVFSPYSIFCCLTYLSFLVTPIVSFVIFKKSKKIFLLPLIYCFYFSLFPFLHIIAPSYCLIADRYCYFPGFFLLFFIYELFISLSHEKALKPAMFFFLGILTILVLRTYIRINDWNNPYTFFQSAINADKNPLYKAYKLIIFANYAESKKNIPLRDSSLEKSLKLLNISLKRLEKDISNNIHEPLTLKLYGLNSNSLLLKTAFSIATIKNDYFNEEPKLILSFYEPYIKKYFSLAGINQLALYASILSKDKQLDNAKSVLEYAQKEFPYSPEIMKSLANFYLYEKDLEKLRNILYKGYKLFPNDPGFIRMLYNYSKLTGNTENEARFAYLIGLREHSQEGYQKACEIYLSLNQLSNARRALKKLIILKSNSTFTQELEKRYLKLSGEISID